MRFLQHIVFVIWLFFFVFYLFLFFLFITPNNVSICYECMVVMRLLRDLMFNANLVIVGILHLRLLLDFWYLPSPLNNAFILKIGKTFQVGFSLVLIQMKHTPISRGKWISIKTRKSPGPAHRFKYIGVYLRLSFDKHNFL